MTRLRRVMAGLVRRANQRLQRLPLLGRVPTTWTRPVRARLFALTPQDVLEAFDALEACGSRPCIAGGWGVDALVGEQTRRHRDLDVLVDPGAMEAATAALARLGYRHLQHGVLAGIHMPDRVVARDQYGRSVDLLAREPSTGVTEVTGSLLRRPVPCLSATTQWAYHHGYDPKPKDLHDLRVLGDLVEPALRAGEPPPGHSGRT